MGESPPAYHLLLPAAALLLLLLPPIAAAQPDYQPPFSSLVDCGSATATMVDGRLWQPDAANSSLLAAPSHILATDSATTLPNTSAAHLLLTASIFPFSATYTFSAAPSRLWLRLYFHPFPYQSFNLSSATFSVSANQFILLSDLRITSVLLFREYSLTIDSDRIFVSFVPSASSFAFINALEIVAMPPDIVDGQSLQQPLLIDNLPFSALQFLHRINVGGPSVSPSNDSSGLFRSWSPNETFLSSSSSLYANSVSINPSLIVYPPQIPLYFAPPIVYSTALQLLPNASASNLSWVLPIDPEFIYVVRLHFCEIVYSSPGQRIFDIFLQNKTVYPALDLALSAMPDTVFFKDFTVNSTGGINTLWINVAPTPNANASTNNSAILNGIEVWKLNNSAGSLDANILPASRSAPSAQNNVRKSSRNLLVALLTVIFVSTFGFVMCMVTGFIDIRRCYQVHTTPSSEEGDSSAVPSGRNLGRIFKFNEIQKATNDFEDAMQLGAGGFGKVYRGLLDDGTIVAVKRSHPSLAANGARQFRTEIQTLSSVRHRHLVSLIGYCYNRREMILVYEFMVNGTLRSHLYGSNLPKLSWLERLDICIGAAHGLHYLHTGSLEGIIHRDVKTSNILLDVNFDAKLSDFGISKAGSHGKPHISTNVKGSFGYMDPEYFSKQRLTEKSDVYSFGVVLLEVLCARPAVDNELPTEEQNLAQWAMKRHHRGRLEASIDPYLRQNVSILALNAFADLAEQCLAAEGVDRPTMEEVLRELQSLRANQESAIKPASDDENLENLASTSTFGVSSEEGTDETLDAIFSQMINRQENSSSGT